MSAHPRSRDDSADLNRLATAVVSAIDLRQVFRPAMAEVREALGFDEAALLVLDDSGSGLELYAATLDPGGPPFRVELPHPHSASAGALERGQTVVVEDTARGEFAFDPWLLGLGLRSHLAHPLRKSGRLLGTLNLASRRPGAFATLRLPLLESVASTLALALDNALLFQRVRASEHLYASVVESARDFIYRLDGDGERLLFANRALADLVGEEPSRLKDRPFRELLFADDLRPERFAPLRSGEADQVAVKLRLRGADGREVATRHRVHAIRDDLGRLSALQGVGREEPRPGPEDRGMRLHQELVEALDDYVFMADTSGRLLAINRKGREALGWEPGDIGDMTIWDLHPAEDKARVERERWKIVETGASSFEVGLLAKSGHTIPARGRVTYSPASGTFQGVYRDITEERLIHDRLLQVERLRALGEMASGVAHTFNNLLAVIGTTVQVARRQVNDAAVLSELDAIRQAVNDGGAAVRRIQDFVRRHPGEPYRELDLNEVLQEVARTAERRVRERPAHPIAVVTEIGEIQPVAGSEAELRDVLLSLVFNAIDAMPEGGTVRIRSRAEGGSAAVEIQDSGRGMTPEVRSRIFTPFFSTKGERGSGLGLAIALDLVSQHGGSIEVDSSPGRGTTMRVLLPAASTRLVPQQRAARVLLVEPEPLLRTRLVRAIAGQGHAVEAAAEGAEALRLLDALPFDCVFTHLAMSPVSGFDVAGRAKARGARVVLLAGWGDVVTEEAVRGFRIDAVLRMPFPEAAALNLIQGLEGGRKQ